MTEVTTHDDQPKRSRREPALVSTSALATHLGCTRQYIARLTAEGVIEKRGDGYDQDASRLKYITHLRSERRRSPRAEAEVELSRAKTEALRLRIAERQRKLIPAEEEVARVDAIIGLMLTHLSALPAKCAGADLSLRRRLEVCVNEMRRELAEAADKFADEAGEPPLSDGA